MKVGIVGLGRLGRLLAQHLGQDADCLVYDLHLDEKICKKLKVRPSSLEEVCQCPIILPIVPISEMEKLLEQMAPHIAADSLIVDVCSVKTLPVKWMQEKLPESVQILGTHPMFGPDSAKQTLYGSKIVVCPVRIEQEHFKNICSYLEVHGLKVIHCTPEEHDQQISESLLLTHFIGRGLIEIEAKPLDVDTKGHRRLIKILETVENDTWQLFQDMNRFNPFANNIRERFLEALKKVDSKVLP